MKALWNNLVVASSDATQIVEGNHYFPADSLRREFFTASNHTTTCHWKGTARHAIIRSMWMATALKMLPGIIQNPRPRPAISLATSHLLGA